MKTKTLILWTLAAISLLFAACEGKKFKTMGDEDMDAVLANDLCGALGGATLQMQASGRICAGWEPYNGCGASGDSSNLSGGQLAAYLYIGTWFWTKNCIFGVPSNVHFSMGGTNEYHGDSKLEQNFGSAFQRWDVTDLDTSTTTYTLNGTGLVIAGGTLNVKWRDKYFAYTDSLRYIDVKIRKTDHAIIGGGGTARIFGTIGRLSSNDFDRKATFVFNPDGSYTVTLDNGTAFTRSQF